VEQQRLRFVRHFSSTVFTGLPSGILLQVNRPIFCEHFLSFHACYISRPSHPYFFNYWNSLVTDDEMVKTCSTRSGDEIWIQKFAWRN
jgi:hypothetical protein